MDPNSSHQQWSEWRFVVRGGTVCPPALMEHNAARLMRKIFGTAARMRVECKYAATRGEAWILTIQAEAANCLDLMYRAHLRAAVERYIRAGLGVSTTVTLDVMLLAGNPETGKAPTQWLALPDAPIFSQVSLWQ